MSSLFQCRVYYAEQIKIIIDDYVLLSRRESKKHNNSINQVSVTQLVDRLTNSNHETRKVTYTAEDYIYDRFYKSWKKDVRRQVEIAGTTVFSVSDYENKYTVIEQKTVFEKIAQNQIIRYRDGLQTLFHAAIKSYVEGISVKPFLLYTMRKELNGGIAKLTYATMYAIIYQGSKIISPEVAKELLEKAVGAYRETFS
ncbi:hypothetical protein [Acidianus brierleyi]|nr:hypothetical protein [Acidianus brierleyi]AWR95453.2 hypothetical protein DFR85_13490 [Acidianus brierleyi]